MSEMKQILVVDDDPAIRKLCIRMLRRMGNEVFETDTGTGALRELESRGAMDAVLLDLNLPDGSGTEWAGRIHELRPDLPIIYFTGANRVQTRAPDSDSKRYFLQKPFTRESIQTVLGQAFG